VDREESRVVEADGHSRWYALRTRARAERRVAARLRRREVEAYCPVVERERTWSDRTKVIAEPMFPGYLFARFDGVDLGRVLSARSVVEVVRSSGVPVPVRPDELEAVRRLEGGLRASEEALEIESVDAFEEGEPVRVVSGPFEGLTGELLEDRGGVRVAVRLTAIAQAKAVRLDRETVRPID